LLEQAKTVSNDKDKKKIIDCFVEFKKGNRHQRGIYEKHQEKINAFLSK
jgi:hypothetical protein